MEDNSMWYYNNPDRIRKIVAIEGLAGCSRILKVRQRAYRERGERLDTVYLTPFICSDDRGNQCVVEYQDDCGEIHRLCNIPTNESICPICGKGWDLNTCHVFETSYSFPNDYLHRHCYQEWMNKRTKDEFYGILSDAGFNMCSVEMKPTKNLYRGDSKYVVSPWFDVYLQDKCFFRIGWRKRVIEIRLYTDWQIPPTLIKELKEKNITCSDIGCHAWSPTDAGKYLTQIKNFNDKKLQES